MSRDLTPIEWDNTHKEHPEWFEVQLRDEKGNPILEDNFLDFPKLGKCGYQFLILAKEEGLLSSNNIKYIKLIEDILLNKVDEELYNHDEDYNDFEFKVNLWYDGQLSPGYTMENNNLELIEAVKNFKARKEKKEE